MNALIKSPPWPPRALAILALIATHLQATLTPPPPPYQDPPLATPIFSADLITSTAHPEGIGNWFLRFDTLPGYLYSIEETQDLTTWDPSPNGYFYGDGTPMQSFICEGPMPPDPALSNGGTGSGTNALQARSLNFEIYLRAGPNSPGYSLLRNGYTPYGTTTPLDPWDAYYPAPANEPLPVQIEGTRLFSFFTFTDYENHILWMIDATVHIYPANTTPPVTNPNLYPDPDPLDATAPQNLDLLNFAKIKPHLIARLNQPPGDGTPDTTPRPHKFARLRRTTPDTNANGIPDWWELLHNYNPFAGNGQPGFCYPGADDDSDGLTNLNEYLYHTDPNETDSDHDGLTDPQEILRGTDPNDEDTDNDGLLDGYEANPDPTNPNGYAGTTNPLDPDTDHDGIGDFEEIQTYLTHPNLRDTDGDGYADNLELQLGTDPLIATSLPGDQDHPNDPDNPYPAPIYEASTFGETRELLYTYHHVTPALGLPGQYYAYTEGSLDGRCTWPEISSYHESLTQISDRIAPEALAGKFITPFAASFPTVDASHYRHFADSASGHFTRRFDYLFPGGQEDHDNAGLTHTRIVLRTASLIHPPITERIHVYATYQTDGGPLTYIEDKITEITILADQQVSSTSINLDKGFQAFTGNSTVNLDQGAKNPKIVLGKDMEGIIGDTIPSMKEGSKMRHFVTPKLSAELPQPTVNLIAEGITATDFEALYKWSGDGINLGAEKNQCSISRAQAGGPYKVQIVSKSQAELVVSEIYVWVVWAEPLVVPKGEGEPIALPGGFRYQTKKQQRPWRFKFVVTPASICDPTVEEKPNLMGAKKQDPPGAKNKHILDETLDCDSATLKWDVSRQAQITMENPTRISAALLKLDFLDAEIIGQPAEVGQSTATVPLNFPADAVEGNDDPLPPPGAGTDENDDPYTKATSPSVLAHEIGELSSVDAPSISIKNALGGQAGDFAYKYDFREFARLELYDGQRKLAENARTWYRISDYSRWHFYFKVEWDATNQKWINKDSETEPDAAPAP